MAPDHTLGAFADDHGTVGATMPPWWPTGCY